MWIWSRLTSFSFVSHLQAAGHSVWKSYHKKTMKKTSLLLLYCYSYFLVCDMNAITDIPTPTSTTYFTDDSNNDSQSNVTQSNKLTTQVNPDNHLTTVLQTQNDKTTSTTSTPCPLPLPTSPPSFFNIMKMEHLLMVTGGLILACTVLLCSTLLLAWKVCQLSRRLKMLSSHSDLMSSAKYWKESTEKKENKSETDANEATVLMSDLNQTCDQSGDGGKESNTDNNKKEEEKVCENGVEQKENGAKNEEPNKTPAAVTENASSPQEEGADSQTSKPEEATTAEDKKEAKDVE